MRFITLICFVLISSVAFAATKPLKIPSSYKICVTLTGELIAKRKCPAYEPIATTQVLTSKLNIQAPLPSFDPANCTRRRSTVSGTLLVTTQVNCLPGEFLLNHGFATDEATVYVNETSLISSGTSYPTAVNYWLINLANNFFTADVDAVCCILK